MRLWPKFKCPVCGIKDCGGEYIIAIPEFGDASPWREMKTCSPEYGEWLAQSSYPVFSPEMGERVTQLADRAMKRLLNEKTS